MLVKIYQSKDFAIDTENRLVVVRGRGYCSVKWVKRVKRYKLPVIKCIRHGDVMCSRATIVNVILHI